MKYFILSLLTVVSFSNINFAQSIDEARMQRDIEVAENVLQSIWTQKQQEESMLLINGSKSQQFNGIYIDDYGVIFHKARGLYGNYFSSRSNNNFTIIEADGGVIFEKKDSDEKEEDSASLKDVEKSAIEMFFSDYASLISQLKPSDRITIRVDNNKSSRFILKARGRAGIGNSDEDINQSFSASILKKDIDAYKFQQITHETFLKKIEYVDEEATQKKEPELELLASLLHRLYKGDLSESFTMRSEPRYERLTGLGVIYHLSFRSKLMGLISSGDAVVWNFSEKTKKDQNEKSYNDRVELLQKEIPQHIIEYGRLLKNLAKKESLIFKIELPKCKDCDSPREMEFRVSQSVLSNYDSNQISLEQAIQQVKKTF